MDDHRNDRGVTPTQGALLVAALLAGLGLVYGSTKLDERSFGQVLCEAIGTALFLAVLMDWVFRRVLDAARKADTTVYDRLVSIQRELQDVVNDSKNLGAQIQINNIQTTIAQIDTTVHTLNSKIDNVAYELQKIIARR